MPGDIEALTSEAELHSDTAVEAVVEAARANGWRIIAFLEQPVARGTRQHGVVAVTREPTGFLESDTAHPPYATATWIYRQEDATAFFEGGHYDLDRDQALASFALRSKLLSDSSRSGAR